MVNGNTEKKLRLASVFDIPVNQIRPAPENDILYKPIDLKSEEVGNLVGSICDVGLLEPITVTSDFFIVSGHRRFAAWSLLPFNTIPCRVLDWRKDDRHELFMSLLRESNRQRVKTNDEILREEIAGIDSGLAYERLKEFRIEQSLPKIAHRQIQCRKPRAKISANRMPFLYAVMRVIENLKEFWPLSDRQIHYALLNDPPLTKATNQKTTYKNNKACYDNLTRLLTQARVHEQISMDVIADETRPVVSGGVHSHVGGFIKQEAEWFLYGYRRNLQQSQPKHIEVVAEKNTVLSVLKPVAQEYCVPLTITRGQCSVPPRYEIEQRFIASGKDKLVLLTVTDFDPDGEAIADSLAASMYDDFGIPKESIEHTKVAFTYEQSLELNPESGMKAKKTSTNYPGFFRHYGNAATFELEAMNPKDLQQRLKNVILASIDLDLFNQEAHKETEDARSLEGYRRLVFNALEGCPDVDFSDDEN